MAGWITCWAALATRRDIAGCTGGLTAAACCTFADATLRAPPFLKMRCSAGAACVMPWLTSARNVPGSCAELMVSPPVVSDSDDANTWMALRPRCYTGDVHMRTIQSAGHRQQAREEAFASHPAAGRPSAYRCTMTTGYLCDTLAKASAAVQSGQHVACAAGQANIWNSCPHDMIGCIQSDGLHALPHVSDEVLKVPEVTISRITVSAEVHRGCSVAKPAAEYSRLRKLLSERQQDAM